MRAKFLGRDSMGRWYYYFGTVEQRLYVLDVPWSAKSVRKQVEPVRHCVRLGERK